MDDAVWKRSARSVKHYQIVTFDIFLGRGTRIRTQTNGFGDRCTTLILFPYKGG